MSKVSLHAVFSILACLPPINKSIALLGLTDLALFPFLFHVSIPFLENSRNIMPRLLLPLRIEKKEGNLW
jgi:hypothetical protein